PAPAPAVPPGVGVAEPPLAPELPEPVDEPDPNSPPGPSELLGITPLPGGVVGGGFVGGGGAAHSFGVAPTASRAVAAASRSWGVSGTKPSPPVSWSWPSVVT